MDRRGFLKSFIAAAAAPTVSRLPALPAAQELWFLGSGGVLYSVDWDDTFGAIKRSMTTHVWECDELKPNSSSNTTHDG